ncbi:MAG TPA: dicarboxylate/amino acid:cation symporter [Gemmatimonadaceae bacterium]|nr:dicarboxylate/amino acid:cation symporter [Gemmatimonadaceae bacterium]
MYALAALAAGLVIGVLVLRSGSAFAMSGVRLIEPVGTMWVNAIRMTVIPLIVSSLIVAISGAGPGMARRLGVRAFAVFFGLLLVAAIIAGLGAPIVFEYLTIDPEASRLIRASAAPVNAPEMPSLSSWFVSLIPSNPFRAAADGAMLPLVVFTIAIGLAVGTLPADTRRPVVDFFAGIAAASTVIVRWILIVAPIGVFALAIALATRVGTGIFGAVGFYLVAHSMFCVVVMLALYVIIVASRRASLGTFARAALPGQVVAASTRTSMAALPANLESADTILRLPRAVSAFTLPLAVSLLRLNQPVSWLVMALFAAKLYGITLSGATMLTIVVTSMLMSFSVPGIPSASLFVVAPFFVAAGIPAESVGVLIALDLIPDFFKTPLNVTGHLAAVTLIHREPPLDGAARDSALEPG